MAFATFDKLSDAVELLSRNLDKNDVAAIAAQCVDSARDIERAVPDLPPPSEYRTYAIQELGRRHAKLSLRVRYWLRRFPSNREEFKLGGHDKELGHVHVDFVRVGDVWQLKEVWICR